VAVPVALDVDLDVDLDSSVEVDGSKRYVDVDPTLDLAP
jgi:hypothetical protein